MATKRATRSASGAVAPRTARPLPRAFEMPWGKGEIVEEASCVTPHHEAVIQLLAYDDGTKTVRFCHYDLRGRFQRSPLMLGTDHFADLRRDLAGAPKLRTLLRRLVA